GNTKPRVSHPLQRAVVTNCYSADPIFRAPAADRATVTTASRVVNSMRSGFFAAHEHGAQTVRMRGAHAMKLLRARCNSRTVERNTATVGRAATRRRTMPSTFAHREEHAHDSQNRK